MTGSIATGRRERCFGDCGSIRRRARSVSAAVGALAIGLLMPGAVHAQNPGPDVIVGDLPDVFRWGQVGGITAFSVGTTSCNIGTQNLLWIASSNQHPVIAQNMYRVKDGRFEQIGMSWLKHGFTALTQSLCDTCSGQGGSVLGVGCSDPYGAGLNGNQAGFGSPVRGGLGPRFEVDAHTGFYQYPYTFAGLSGNAIYKRLQVDNNDLDPGQNAGAQYFVEGHYVTPDDAAAGNQDNNASYRPINVTGTPGSGNYFISLTGSTVRQQPAILAWEAGDPAVSIDRVGVPGVGHFILGSKIIDLGGGRARYEYAVHNLNSHRSGQSFSVQIPPGSVVNNFFFNDVVYHSGEPWDGADWVGSVVGNRVTWSTDDFATNPNANALRWGTTYSFGFEAEEPHGDCPATLELFRPGMMGDPESVSFTKLVTPGAGTFDASLINPGQQVSVVGNDMTDLMFEPVVIIKNLTGPLGTISVTRLPCDLHPGATFFDSLGKTLRINTTLADGEYWMFVSIPFDLATGTGSTAALRYWSGAEWKLWFEGNIPATLERVCGKIGPNQPPTSFSTLDNLCNMSMNQTTPPVLGNGGVVYDTTTQRGFAWGFVNHTTDFSVTVSQCPCLGDLSGDGRRDGADIRGFIDCLLGGGAGNCNCADIDGLPGLNVDDVDEFVSGLLAGTACL